MSFDPNASDESCTCPACGSYRPCYPYTPEDPCLRCRELARERVSTQVPVPGPVGHGDRAVGGIRLDEQITHIERALRHAFEAGRREGLEEAHKITVSYLKRLHAAEAELRALKERKP